MSDINIVLENRDDIRVAVEEKDINVEVPAGKDGRSLHPRGEWSASAAYAYLDLVSYEGSSYVATKAVPAGTLPTDTSYWMLSAEKGEPGGAVWGNIAGDLSDQTDLQTALDSKAPVIINSASGSIASFSDGSASPVTALTVSIEPVQDLHGLDAPCPPSGKNLLNPDTMASGYLEGSGNPHSQSWTMEYYSTEYYEVGSQTTISIGYNAYASNESKWLAINWYDENKNNLSRSINDANSFYTFNVVSGAVYFRVSMRTYDHGVNQCYAALGSDTSFVPYSNICPISGHTEVNIVRAQKSVDLLTEQTWVVGGISGSNGGDNNSYVYSIRQSNCSNNLDAIITINPKKVRIQIAYYTGNKTGFISRQTYYDNQTKTTFDIASLAPVGTNYYRISVFRTDGTDIDITHAISSTSISTILADVQIFETDCETITIDLGGTIYGGMIDVLTGTMTVTHQIVDLASLTWVRPETWNGWRTNDLQIVPGITDPSDFYAEKYKSEWYDTITPNTYTGYGLAIGSTAKPTRIYTSNPDGVKPTGNLVFPLPTPLTVQLTPSQMQTLIGKNNIWSDTGDTEVTYRADTKLYIDGKFSQLQALILEN